MFYSHMGHFVFERSVFQIHFFHGAVYRFGREARGIFGMSLSAFLAALLSILSIVCNYVLVNITRGMNYLYYVLYRDVSLPVLPGPHYRTVGASTIRRHKSPKISTNTPQNCLKSHKKLVHTSPEAGSSGFCLQRARDAYRFPNKPGRKHSPSTLLPGCCNQLLILLLDVQIDREREREKRYLRF